MRLTVLLVVFGCAFHLAHADNQGLRRAGNRNDVTISGVSSGAAMAMQYAVANSGWVRGVGSIAGPSWGCAAGSVATAVNNCMCAGVKPESKTRLARTLADSLAIDIVKESGRPTALKRAYVFQSEADDTVTVPVGRAAIQFLTDFMGVVPEVDVGIAGNGSNQAGHGIVSREGTDSCKKNTEETTTKKTTTYIRQCGNEDTAGNLFNALYGPGPIDGGGRQEIAGTEVWEFNQGQLIQEVKDEYAPKLSPDRWWPPVIVPYQSSRRENFDMAETGYIYVPPFCRDRNKQCRVHVALHGCKQKAEMFAKQAGYNNWAQHHRVIVVYPAIQPDSPSKMDNTCSRGGMSPFADVVLWEPNDNGCWDWWGYLDHPDDGISYRYLTKEAPQMRVITRIIDEVTKQ